MNTPTGQSMNNFSKKKPFLEGNNNNIFNANTQRRNSTNPQLQ